MNKKLIAIAVASVMAAPVAMADITVSGRVGLHLTAKSFDDSAKDSTGVGDKGQSRLQFDGTAGDAYARIALDGRLGRDNHSHTLDAALPLDADGNANTDETSTDNSTKRDNYLGYKMGGASVQVGRMATAGKNIEKDPLIATFLQTRSTAAESATGSKYGSSSFVNHLIQAKFKAGAATITAQYDIGDKSSSSNEGHTAIAVTGKGGPVRYWASYNNAEADGNDGSLTTSQSNIKVGASMKFGKAKVGLNYTSADKDTGAGGESDSITVTGDIGMGNGLTIHAGVATQDAGGVDNTWMRIAVSKKLSKGASAYAGYTASSSDTPNSDTSEIGAGMTVKF